MMSTRAHHSEPSFSLQRISRREPLRLCVKSLGFRAFLVPLKQRFNVRGLGVQGLESSSRKGFRVPYIAVGRIETENFRGHILFLHRPGFL